jgi:hypothetical protein
MQTGLMTVMKMTAPGAMMNVAYVEVIILHVQTVRVCLMVMPY